ncbi:MAG: hypothetical protein C0603_03630 [Denitrovibrio sp.]|nr:MAG: hypothetical protein C0603_03630 [Denitrovibrio sp.]
MKSIFSIISIIILTTAFSSFAYDSYEEYVRKQMNEYQTYLEEIDREFTSFLKQTWQPYEGEKPKQLLDKPKPVDIPVAKPMPKPEPIKIKPKPKPVVEKPKPQPKPIIKDEKPKPAPKPVVKPEPVVPEPMVKEPVVKEPVVTVPEPEPQYVPQQEPEGFGLSFYGTNLDIPVDKKFLTPVKNPLSSKNIAKWWETIASSDYKKTLKYLQKSADKMQIGDWGYVNLVERFAAKLLGKTPERKMLVWFFLNKAGYDAKLGYSKSGITKVMMPSDSQLFGTPFYTFSNVRYYVIDVFGRKEPTESLYTYNGKYPAAKKILSMSKMDYPKLGFAGYSRDLKFETGGKNYVINAIANRYSIAYLNNFPQADLSVYTNAKTPDWIEQTILPELKKILKGKSKRESINILLKFVQTAFEYKTDDVQFGREKFLFTEETLYYPFSDCEDRSVLFAYLVGKLTDLDLIMLDFPGHIAVAVDLGAENTGAVVDFKGKSYSVTDPTYINATAGMIMPQYKRTNPEIIEPQLR